MIQTPNSQTLRRSPAVVARAVVLFFVFFGVACHASSRTRAEEHPVRVVLIPAASTIQVCDPVFLKISVKNNSDTEQEILWPDRQGCTLGICVEFKPYVGKFESVAEWGDSSEVSPVEPKGTLRAGQRFNTYDRLCRGSDGDFIFRKVGTYRLYADLRLPGGRSTKSAEVEIHVNPRPQREQQLIENQYELIRSAILRDEIYLKDPKNVAELDKIRQSLNPGAGPGTLRNTLDWRIPLFKAKYGSDDDRRSANRLLDRFEQSPDFPEPCRDILCLLRARVALDLDDSAGAQRHLEKLKDDSLERRHLEFLISAALKKNQ
jgi:hypothetical protein